MKVNGIQYSSAKNSLSTKNYQSQNVAFNGIVAEVAKDSQDVLVRKDVKRFFRFMKSLVRKAAGGKEDSQTLLKGLIGEEAATQLIKDKKAFTKKADETTKLIPLSGLGTRGKEIRDTITGALGMKPTHKAVMPLPAQLGMRWGKPVYLNTVNNEFLHMMHAKVLSPFESLRFVNSKTSDGDLSVVVKGIKKGFVPTDKVAIMTYTDDIGTQGHKDYENLLGAFKKEPANSNTEVISVGFKATKQETEGKLGAFLPEGGAYKVFEKPNMEKLNELLGEENEVLTNIGKTLYTPKGLHEIAKRDIADPDSLKKTDKGELKYHVVEGVLKLVGKNGALKVIPKGGQFSDIGNGTVFTDKMVEIANGKMQEVFPEFLEAQIKKNVILAEDGKTAVLDYGKAKITLPTSQT